MRSFAEHLIVSDASGNMPSEPDRPPIFPVTSALRPHLATLVGKDGARALLARALALAAAEVPWLGAVRVDADGDVEGLEAAGVGLDPAEILEGRVVWLAQLLGLLVAFIGPNLTSRLVGEIWPRIPFQDRDFGMEQENEKAS